MIRLLPKLLPLLVGGILALPLLAAGCAAGGRHASGPAGPEARTSVAPGAHVARGAHVAPGAHVARGTSCFAHPGACGFPAPRAHNVGARRPCSRLRHSGSIVIRRAGRTVRGLDIHGQVTIAAPHVTLANVCVTTNGHAQLGSWAVEITGRSRGTVIRDATIRGLNRWRRSVEIAVRNVSGHWATLERVSASRCGECIHDGPWTIRDSYLLSNGMRGTGDHYEAVYCSDTSVRLAHDTVLNPYHQTAVVFCDTRGGGGGPCVNRVSITRSLLAGGGYMIYACGNASSRGRSRMVVRNNVFARCRTRPIRFNRQQGGYACRGSRSNGPGAGRDRWGYWPRGGYYGVLSGSYCPRAGTHRWAHNIWNDNHRRVRCRNA